MNVLVWLKRDLRVEDHPALALAAGMGRVLPVYIVEPEFWAQPDASARQWEFVAGCLEDLRDALRGRGMPLAVRVGDAVAVLEKLCRLHGIARIVSHEEVGNLWTFARDLRVVAWAKAAGIEWIEVPQSGVVRRLATPDDRAARHARFVGGPLAEVGTISPVPGVEPGAIPTARALRLAEDRCAHVQAGGRARGLLVLETFLERRGEGYRAAMASPVTAERACSRVSAHLAWGSLSAREVAQRASARQAERPGGAWTGSLKSFQSRLAWRDQFIQRLEDNPDLQRRSLQPEALARGNNGDHLLAWRNGETGVPFVDACMRYLAATGWLNFRARAMVMSFASYHLWLDWRATGTVLAQRFTDYEPGIHWPQVQMQSGVTGTNALRIYNPVKQGMELDPSGIFTRRWVPELAAVPDIYLQEPWKWPGAQGLLGRRYPEPVVDLAVSAKAARVAVGRVLVAGTVPTQADRTGATDHFIREGMRRARPAPVGQLVMEF